MQLGRTALKRVRTAQKVFEWRALIRQRRKSQAPDKGESKVNVVLYRRAALNSE